jgi:hypothetical protein
LRIHTKLLSRLLTPRASDRLTLKAVGPSVLFMSENTAMHWSEPQSPTSTNPYYNLSLCVKRSERREWYEYVDEAWSIFLQGNTSFFIGEYVKLYKDLHKRLVALASVLLRGLAQIKREWPIEGNMVRLLLGEWEDLLDRWLSLDKHAGLAPGESHIATTPGPWKIIISRTAVAPAVAELRSTLRQLQDELAKI